MMSKTLYICLIVFVYLIQSSYSQFGGNVQVVDSGKALDQAFNEVLNGFSKLLLGDEEKKSTNQYAKEDVQTNNLIADEKVATDNAVKGKPLVDHLDMLEREEGPMTKEDSLIPDTKATQNEKEEEHKEETKPAEPAKVEEPPKTESEQPAAEESKNDTASNEDKTGNAPASAPSTNNLKPNSPTPSSNSNSNTTQNTNTPNTSANSNDNTNTTANTNNNSNSNPNSNSNTNINTNTSATTNTNTNTNINTNTNANNNNNKSSTPSNNGNANSNNSNSNNNQPAAETQANNETPDASGNNQNVIPNAEQKTSPQLTPLNVPNVDGGKTQNKEKKSGFKSVMVKVGLGVGIAGVCIAGLVVGKNKLSKSDDDDIFRNMFKTESIPATISTNASLNRNLEGVDNTPNYDYQPLQDNYQPTIEIDNNYANVPAPKSPSTNDFINTNSIEPLPNLVNKVDVELPVYNIKEENYNTVGRPMDEAQAAAGSWNKDDDKPELPNNKNINNNGYNNIVPEIGQMVIEHTNCPSFTSSMFDALDELHNEKNDDKNDNMKQIIPDIQYATVEVNNEFNSIIIEDEDHNNDNNNMKQIIPNIQYATVEVNNEFAGIDDDSYRATLQRQRSSYGNDSEVQELRVSRDFLAMPNSYTDFHEISETYHNAIRDSYEDAYDKRDSLSSNGSILHQLR